MNIRIGLALGGGGARGSYQIGVVRALHEMGILNQIKDVSGTSIGAINTLMVMADYDYERMIEVWEKINNHDIYGYGPDRFKEDKLGVFSLQETFKKLSAEVKLSEIRESKITGYATAAKLQKDSLIEQLMIHRMKREVFKLNEVEDPHKAVLASASIPVIFGSTKIDDQAYVDGGTVDNCPVQPLIDAGCNVIFAVPLDMTFKPRDYANENILLVNMQTHYLFKLISADVLDFKVTVVSENAHYGYKLANAMLDKLKAHGFMSVNGIINKPEGYRLVEFLKTEEQVIWEEENGS